MGAEVERISIRGRRYPIIATEIGFSVRKARR